MKSIYQYVSFKKVLWKLRKYLSTCNISINNLWWLVKQSHYCVRLVRSLAPNYLGLVRFHPHNFKQPEEHMTPVKLDAILYVSTFIISSDIFFWWLYCQPFEPYCNPSWIPFIISKPFWNELNDIVVSDCIKRMSASLVLFNESFSMNPG